LNEDSDWCYVTVQFKLVEVSRLFLLQPGNEASVQTLSSTFSSR